MRTRSAAKKAQQAQQEGGNNTQVVVSQKQTGINGPKKGPMSSSSSKKRNSKNSSSAGLPPQSVSVGGKSNDNEEEEEQLADSTIQEPCSEHTIELTSILLTLDGHFVRIMRDICAAKTAKLFRLILGRENDQVLDLTVQQLILILPKCDPEQINEIAAFLLTAPTEVPPDKIMEFATDNHNGNNANAAPPPPLDLRQQMDLLPLQALERLLAQNSMDRVGLEPARALRKELVNCGIMSILLDGLSHYSHQNHRFGPELLGYLDFHKAKPSANALRTSGSKKRRVEDRAPTPFPSDFAYFGGRQPKIMKSKLPSTSSALSFTLSRERLRDERMVEAHLKVFNIFLLGSDLIPMDISWLELFYRSSMRNTVRAYLMNGNLTDLVELSSTFGALFQLLNLLANSEPVFVEDLRRFYEKSNDRQQQGGSSSSFSSASSSGGTLVSPFQIVLGEDPTDQAGNDAGPCCSISAQPIVQLLRSFAAAIEGHFKQGLSALNAQYDNGEGEELMTLSSLASLCTTVLQMVEKQDNLIRSIGNISDPEDFVKQQSLIETAKADLIPAKNDGKRDDGPTSSNDEKQKDGQQQTGSNGGGEGGGGELEQQYCGALKDLQFDTIPFDLAGHLIPHHFRAKFGAGASMGTANQRMKRICKELFALRNGLVLSSGSAAFVRASEEHMDALKVLITGPEGTPYENGCFEFDFIMDQNFPTRPPQVHFMTTGNGSVRFNPNLYDCGKVCLSLLGTWPGRSKDEEWHAEHSSLLQVITSIQSLILVPDPYFNEPGFVNLRNKPQGKLGCRNYNLQIRQHTIRWAIIEQIRHPPAGFEEVVRRHFLLKWKQIGAQMDRWSEEATAGAMKTDILSQKDIWQKEFDKLGRLDFLN